MYRLIHLFRSSIGSKLLVAASGVLLLTFLLGHAAGNLLILKGPGALNAYADWLQGHPLLWGFRLGMLALFTLHVLTAVRLARENRAARPVRYRRIARLGARLPGRLMVLSGALVLAFVVFHLLHLTLGAVGPEVDAMVDGAGRVDVYARVVASFREPWLVGLYVGAMLLLGLHLVHAIEGLFQTFGFNHESYQGLIRFLAPALSLLIVAGFAAIPLLVLGGVIGAAGA
ncbi:MAG: Succinate dehydrogenase/fumarate reductase, cytochrome b558 subunit [Pseudomonadota bacterium]|jgi:succinate dehydrogenase / fumarate reductase cytochrome b subunit